ncbi:MAG: hypothetical protein PHO29_14385, partial [Acetobacterium sp.]|nr:hypothetical protein [Acetobacterium sp.]
MDTLNVISIKSPLKIIVPIISINTNKILEKEKNINPIYLIVRHIKIIYGEKRECPFNILKRYYSHACFHLRRGQLQQVLILLAEDADEGFITTVDQIIQSPDIRFHLKHLILEIIGQIDKPSEFLVGYCQKLFTDICWEQHLLETVYYGHPHFIINLIDNGIMAYWLDCVEDKYINRAIWLLASVIQEIPERIVDILEPFIEKGAAWLDRILNTIGWMSEVEDDAVFELRLKLARLGIYINIHNWNDLCKKQPRRALRLLETIVSTWDINKEKVIGRPNIIGFEHWHNEELNSFKQIISDYYVETWDMFMTHIERLTRFNSADYVNLYRWQKPRNLYRTIEIERSLVDILIVAGKVMANKEPKLFLERFDKIKTNPSKIIQEIIIESLSHLPHNEADIGIQWLLEDFSRIQIGDDFSEEKWMSAFRLLKEQSPYCSFENFEQVEKSLVFYHEPDEKDHAKYRLKGWKHGYYGHYWGEAQYFLLPALATERISQPTAELIKTLNRKFDLYPKDYFKRGQITGGTISSKLNKNINKISDRSWLEILSNSKVPLDGHKWQQITPGHAVESSILQFARSLGFIAERYPERFARLILQFPNDVHPAYVSAIIDAVALTQPGNRVPEEEKAEWEPASFSSVLASLDSIRKLDDQEAALSFCRLIRNRAEEDWPDQIIERLIDLAINHPDLEPGKLNVSCDKNVEEVSSNTLFQNTINCVRGAAAEAIG